MVTNVDHTTFGIPACSNLSRIADSDVSLTNGSDSSSSTDASPTFQDWDDELQDARCALDASQRKVKAKESCMPSGYNLESSLVVNLQFVATKKKRAH